MRRLAVLALLPVLAACDGNRLPTGPLTFIENGDAVGEVTARPVWHLSCGDEGCSTIIRFGELFAPPPSGPRVWMELPNEPVGTLQVVYPRWAGLGGPPAGRAYLHVETGGRTFYSRTGTLRVRRAGSELRATVDVALADTTGLGGRLTGEFAAEAERP